MATMETGAVVGGRYELGRSLGTGGMARVFLAHDRLLDREVAVKVLSERYAADPAFVERFRREASSAAGLNHPNIVAVYDRGEADGSYYIVMEYLPGPDLKEVIRRRGPLPPIEAVDAALQVLAALAAAHRRDVIHRDVKPQNVLMAADGHLKVTDFGIARAGGGRQVTEEGAVIGTAQYLSPEQARGQEVTAASDCYAVGIVLYEMLTGRVPFDGDKTVAVAMRQINEPPIAPRLLRPEIPPELDAVVMKALEKRPAARYRTAEELTQALIALRGGLPGATDRPTSATAILPVPVEATQVMGPPTGATRALPPRGPVTPPPAPPPRRRRWLPLVLALVALLAIGGGLAAYFLLRDSGPGTAAVPGDLAGKSAPAARQELAAMGFTNVTSSDQRSANVAQGNVIDSDPAGGTRIKKDALVRLLVSAGPSLVDVPDVKGQPLDQAEATLQARGFKVEPTNRSDETVPEGSVISQDPAAGQQAGENSTVTLVVSSGPVNVKVPDVRLMSEDEAKTTLHDAKLKVRVTTKETTARPEGTVVDQSNLGEKVLPGTTITIQVAKAPAVRTIPMPTLIGLTAQQANRKMQQNGFDPRVGSPVSDAAPAGQVLTQEPQPDTPITVGGDWDFTYSIGSTPTDQGTTPSAPPSATGTTP